MCNNTQCLKITLKSIILQHCLRGFVFFLQNGTSFGKSQLLNGANWQIKTKAKWRKNSNVRFTSYWFAFILKEKFFEFSIKKIDETISAIFKHCVLYSTLMKMPGGIENCAMLQHLKPFSLFRVFGRNEGFKKVFKFDCPVARPFKLLVTNDKTLLAILSIDRVKNKECVNVYHSRKGILLHKIILK